ncbi:mycofactocin-coupled SDR family oxidoreductase [Gordonia sp. HNM0687]|uniref:Mycofactocin-coupled SDR family oxidoreductase n=1 Tax=Gordonia mangrovi TaxID=2665643 RepID=A0A6L7GWA6_9ACTN|nr:mycofactocin-coupled SDR family oxidoreductase [Gordonia mangrovi]MXP24256.1 mycofactocin-coupled SDR family oxidoreductase [Gordonia mangrovi]UVF79923.1 mycofactocin-coupled SDR family oxidoreductase [Gordonia mangrovi]
MGILEGKVAFVTGAARGQGRAHAVTLASEGADVIAIDIDDPIANVAYAHATTADLEETAAQVEKLDRRILAITADVRSSDQLDTVVAKGISMFGKIDVVVANAGIFTQAPFWEMDEQMWDDVQDVNLKGVWRTMKAVVPHMIENRRGSIVLTSSVNSVIGNPNAAHYAASKHGVLGLMRSAAQSLGPLGIRVNSVAPGLIDTPMTNFQTMYDQMAGHPGADRSDYDKAALHYGILRAQGSLPPETIANAAAWLASDGTYAVTGQNIVVDAGHTIMPGFNPAPVETF